MTCRGVLVTNNPFLKSVSSACEFVDGTSLDVLKRTRDLIHMGWVLLTHPLYGNLRPHQHPYRSVLLEGPHDFPSTDQLSLEYIENAVAIFTSPTSRMMSPEDAPPAVREDFAFIDAELMKESLSRYGLALK